MEQWTYHETYSGSPQGSGVSPILANIYLNELDEFMARMKKSFDKGDTRSRKVHKDHDKVLSGKLDAAFFVRLKQALQST